MSGHFQTGLLQNFAAQRGFGRFAPFDFAAGNAPFVRPFVRADHQHLVFGIENQRADGGERRLRFFKLF